MWSIFGRYSGFFFGGRYSIKPQWPAWRCVLFLYGRLIVRKCKDLLSELRKDQHEIFYGVKCWIDEASTKKPGCMHKCRGLQCPTGVFWESSGIISQKRGQSWAGGQRVTATAQLHSVLFSCCCSVLTLYRAEDQVALVLCRERTVWPVRNVVPTTAPIYPHKFPSKLTILTQARPTTLHTEQKPHKGSQEVGEDYIQETRDTCSTHHLPRRKPKK